MRESLLCSLEQIKILGSTALATRRSGDSGEYVDSGSANGFKSASLSFVESLYGKNHSYYDGFIFPADHSRPADIESGMEILKSIEREIWGDWVFTFGPA